MSEATGAADAALEAASPAEALDALVKPRMRGWIHTWALAVAAVAVAVLVATAATVSATAGWSTLIYGVTVCGLFGISAVYHRVTWRTPRTRIRMKRADHSMIFLFIAGSYTPFALLGLPGRTGQVLLAVVWAGALAGVALKLLWPTAPRWVGVPLYLLLGWAIVPVAGQLHGAVGWVPLLLLLAGGLMYSGGAILYATKWPNPWPEVFGHHEFFHAATVLAALCHYVAIWLVVLG
ncbi:hemolysin III [Nocardia farcinica]|uniref:Hemolysin n=3 Tax=Nocardiaceae TaxID=85025 RepID=A0A0H5P4T9_NOCFR|nr:putative hemolysin III homolog [Nocardia farcinica IFM 10152]CRY82682.1 hemolysin [Nocardia farcinica]SIT26274.1 hemolysin III [Nocardia farcinica]SUE32387.1 hemolysin-iii like protein [Nocardia farcinica]VFA92527.1 hemolysin [Nocardia farcinica]